MLKYYLIMQKKPLKVQAALKIYQAKYPSYEDKNPLLYPETRPYPFSHKFIKWASTGGLVSIMLFGGNQAQGQAQQDSLYNPFPLENAGVPYMPVMFGTGMPERLRSEEAIQTIRKAFADSGIELEENVWLKDEDVGVYLNGYNQEEEIGFLFMDYSNMDNSFLQDSPYAASIKSKASKVLGKKDYDLKDEVDRYEKNIKHEFQRFVEDKEKYIKQLTRYSPKDAQKKYAKNLLEVDAQIECEELFNSHHLQYNLDRYRENLDSQEPLIKEIIEHIDGRLKDSIKKYILFQYASSFRVPRYHPAESYPLLKDEFKKLKTIKSDKDFTKNYLIFYEFLKYNSGINRLGRDTSYQAIKLDIMSKYSLKKWFDHVDELDDYQGRSYVSLKEAKRIDKKNKNGSQFIAPISARDQLMIVPSSFSFGSEELLEEQKQLRQEFNRKNGMTDDIMSQKRAELNALSDKYSWDKMKDLPRVEKDSLQQLQKQERANIKAKYKAMEKLTDEERAEFEARFEELRQRTRAWQEAHQEEVKMKTLRQLEGQVKLYIKWAKSQMGG